jgi:hypothetical protein
LSIQPVEPVQIKPVNKAVLLTCKPSAQKELFTDLKWTDPRGETVKSDKWVCCGLQAKKHGPPPSTWLIDYTLSLFVSLTYNHRQTWDITTPCRVDFASLGADNQFNFLTLIMLL